ncbi:lipase [Lithospermum erythrorhizon]|uniref:Lipase n=1 Tax=Lithospermum erythrorhizon TaxID=34254 RepID=A0AAV3QM39_LITER
MVNFCCLWFTMFCFLLHYAYNAKGSPPPKVPAMFVFGDSLVDNGNNNDLNSFAKANYYPYGIDFRGPTGRFSNGETVIDLLAKLLGVPSPPPFANPATSGSRILGGVNYASAAGGILDESGQHFGDRFPLSRQVINFENSLSQLRTMMSGRDLNQYLSRSIAIMVLGSNDYINNYFLPFLYTTSYNYNASEFANLLLNHYARQLVALYSVGLRKFLLVGIGPLGCIPNQLATSKHDPGRCVDNVNQMLGFFNQGLVKLVDYMNNGTHPGSIFVYGNVYGAIGDILNNPSKYGMSNSHTSI